MFNKQQLFRLLIPLLIEQILAVLVGMADTMMVASVGESAVSGVSLVDSINIVMITLFASLATGGAVVCAQHIGAERREDACKSANQLLLSVTVISMIFMVVSLVFNKAILRLMFGSIEQAIMNNAITYFYITAVSFPFLAIYNACAAIYRSMGNSKVSMYTSLIMNVINVGGNALCIFVLKMGVTGVAIPTLVSRAVAAVIMLIIVRSPYNYVHIHPKLRLGYDFKVIKQIMKIGLPNGLEGSLFNIAKLALQSLVATLGSTAIASYAVTGSIITLESIPSMSIGLALITVVGQCVGAKEYGQAKKYTTFFIGICFCMLMAISFIIFIFLEPIVGLYNLSHAAAELTKKLILVQFTCLAFHPFAFTIVNALRAASDAKFPMYVSISSAFAIRIGLSYVLVKGLGWDLMGVWIPMLLDWVVRAAIYTPRFYGGFWLKKLTKKGQ